MQYCEQSCIHVVTCWVMNMKRCIAQAECVQHGLRTIAFCHTRKMCELVMAYTRETLKATAPHLSDTISVYRAGYSPAVGPTNPTT